MGQIPRPQEVIAAGILWPKPDCSDLWTAMCCNHGCGNVLTDFQRPWAQVLNGKSLGKETDLYSFHMAVLIAVSFHLS